MKNTIYYVVTMIIINPIQNWIDWGIGSLLSNEALFYNAINGGNLYVYSIILCALSIFSLFTEKVAQKEEEIMAIVIGYISFLAFITSLIFGIINEFCHLKLINASCGMFDSINSLVITQLLLALISLVSNYVLFLRLVNKNK